MRAVNYLGSLRPSDEKLGILGPKKQASAVEKAQYDRALTVAQQPLVVLDHIKEGTLTPNDVNTLKAVHPDLYSRMSEKIYNEIMDVTSKEETIPYSMKLSLSTFLGQPLDLTMTQQGIAMNQLPGPQQPQPKLSQGPHSYKGLAKLPKEIMTPEQARASLKVAKA